MASPSDLRRAVTAYGVMVGWCAIIALALAGLLQLTGINPMPFSQLIGLRTAFTLFVWIYLGATLFGLGSRAEVIAVTAIPFLTQFYQVALGRDFGQGTAIVRIVPYILMAVAMAVAIVRRHWRPSANEVMVFGAVWLVALLGVAAGIHLTSAGIPAVFYLAILLPLFYAYIESLEASGPPRLNELMLALTAAAFLLLAGTFVTLQIGLRVETAQGFGTVASAMQASDFNSVAAYLLLLWPFALAFCVRRSRVLVVVLLVALVVTVFVGLSRTMLILTPLLVIGSLPGYFRRITVRDTLSFVIIAVPASGVVLWLLSRWSLTSFTLFRWVQRLNLDVVTLNSISLADIISSIGPGSRSQQDRALVREQGWEMFRSSPILGQGWGTYPFFSSVEQASAHSLTVDWLSQTGLLGAGLLWSLIALALFRMARGFLRFGVHRRLLVAFITAFVLWLIAAHTLGAQVFLASEQGFTSGAINGVLLVLFLSRHTMNHVLRGRADPT